MPTATDAAYVSGKACLTAIERMQVEHTQLKEDCDRLTEENKRLTEALTQVEKRAARTDDDLRYLLSTDARPASVHDLFTEENKRLTEALAQAEKREKKWEARFVEVEELLRRKGNAFYSLSADHSRLTRAHTETRRELDQLKLVQKAKADALIRLRNADHAARLARRQGQPPTDGERKDFQTTVERLTRERDAARSDREVIDTSYCYVRADHAARITELVGVRLENTNLARRVAELERRLAQKTEGDTRTVETWAALAKENEQLKRERDAQAQLYPVWRAQRFMEPKGAGWVLESLLDAKAYLRHACVQGDAIYALGTTAARADALATLYQTDRVLHILVRNRVHWLSDGTERSPDSLVPADTKRISLMGVYPREAVAALVEATARVCLGWSEASKTCLLEKLKSYDVSVYKLVEERLRTIRKQVNEPLNNGGASAIVKPLTAVDRTLLALNVQTIEAAALSLKETLHVES